MIRPFVTAVVLGCLVGCSTPPSTGAEDGADESVGPAVERARDRRAERSAGDDPGVVIERFRCRPGRPQPGPTLEILRAEGFTPEGADEFRAHGFDAIIVPSSSLARLEAGLGEEAFTGRTWHGEAHGWRSVASRRLAPGTAVLLDGRPRRSNDDILALAFRGWSIPTVDDDAIYLEIVPHVAGARLDLIATPRQIGELRGTPISSTLCCRLEADESLILVSAEDLTPEDDEASEEPASGGGGFSGPIVPLPPTPAAWLIDEPLSGDRGVIVIEGRPRPTIPNPG